MYLENNNIKVLKIFVKFSIKNQWKFLKILENSEIFLENIEKCFRKFSKFLQNLENILKKLKIRKHQQLNCFELNKYIIV